MSKKSLLIFVAAILLALMASIVLLTNRANAPTPKSENSAVDTSSSPAPQPESFDRAKFSLTDPASIWLIANKKRPISPIDYAPSDLVAVGGGQQLRREAATALSQLIAAAKAEGHVISPLSGYRSYGTQVSVYSNEVKTNGQAVADTQSARPGHSEHQTGLAIDVGGGGCGIEDCFGNTAPGKWLAAHAHEYGFIIRYTSGKEAITGYRAEPWHIRYIGTDLSKEMNNTGVQTLEEFFGLAPAPTY